MDFRLIFYLIKPQFYDDYRGLFLIVKATLRLASLGLDTPLKSSPSSFKIGFCKEKNRFFVTYVSELSVTHVTDCTKLRHKEIPTALLSFSLELLVEARCGRFFHLR